MPRNSFAEVERRVTIVFEMIVKGYSRAQVIEWANKVGSEDPSWAVDVRTLDSYMAQARELLKASSETIRAETLGRTLERREDLYHQAVKHMDLKTALAIDQDTAKLLDLYPVNRTIVSFDEVNPYAQLTQEALLTLLDTLNRALDGPRTGLPALPQGEETGAQGQGQDPGPESGGG
jgi:hypothetical protein